VTNSVETITVGSQVADVMRRAISVMRMGRPGPAMVEIPADLVNEEVPDALIDAYRPVKVTAAGANARDVESAARVLREARRPVIHAGQGVLYSEASSDLVELAELLQAPVMVTLEGKSAFPEDHPLALGTAARTRPATVDRFFERADLILGIGTSFSRSLYITPMPADAVLGQIVDDRRDLASGYDIAFGCVGDARLVLKQLLEALDGADPNSRRTADYVASVRKAFLAEWMSRLTSDASPLSPYRIVWELMQVVDRSRTVVTHDAGHPRDQIVPFYETIVPRGYLGWGKSTQLGTGLGLTMGAQLARPDWLAVNIMGDSAFGMVGMDLETAVRERIPILTIVMNNGLMGGYGEWMPDAVQRYSSNRLGGSYAEVGSALGAYTERVTEPAELRQALERCIASVESGRAALLEVITHEEPVLAAP
jgi:thiamine pyrophosphate-dependent acetolactate synthase large subunit-like protein